MGFQRGESCLWFLVRQTMTLAATEDGLRDNSLRVAIVLSGLSAGGAERVVSILSREWAETGHQVTIICFEF